MVWGDWVMKQRPLRTDKSLKFTTHPQIKVLTTRVITAKNINRGTHTIKLLIDFFKQENNKI